MFRTFDEVLLELSKLHRAVEDNVTKDQANEIFDDIDREFEEIANNAEHSAKLYRITKQTEASAALAIALGWKPQGGAA
jgi:hypothetical protein